MTLLEWTRDTLKDGVELFSDEKLIFNGKAQVTRNVQKLRAISLGVISSEGAEEWYKICRLTCPVGTVMVDFKIDREAWEELYSDTLALVRNELTKSLLNERCMKSAKVLIEVLARRDKTHWSDDSRDTVVKAEGNGISLEFQVRR